MIGLVTADAAAPLDPDLVPFHEACTAVFGDEAVRIVSWDDPTVDWAGFRAVIIRSTWDYTDRLDDFLDWVDRTAAVTRLVNSPRVIRWNADKRYLAELERAGVPITPTVFVAPGEVAPSVEGLHVVKPTVGAGSSGARRCESHEVADHVAVLHAEGRTAMVQPYLGLLDTHGETALCFVPSADGDGLELSHAFRKGAILTSTEVEQEGDLFAKEDITPRTPSSDELELAAAVFASDVFRSFAGVAFARVDVAPVATPDGGHTTAVLELELIEPSFYLDTSPGAADLFAERLAVWLDAAESGR